MSSVNLDIDFISGLTSFRNGHKICTLVLTHHDRKLKILALEEDYAFCHEPILRKIHLVKL